MQLKNKIILFLILLICADKLLPLNYEERIKDFSYQLFYSKKFKTVHLTTLNLKKQSVEFLVIIINAGKKITKRKFAFPYKMKYFQFPNLKRGHVIIHVLYKYKFDNLRFKKLKTLKFKIK